MVLQLINNKFIDDLFGWHCECFQMKEALKMRVDKTLSELYDLLDSTWNERLLSTARMAVNTIKRLQNENEQITTKWTYLLQEVLEDEDCSLSTRQIIEHALRNEEE